jgi:CheY-like chemotaxis protein
MAGDRERCLQAGMDDYITKPIRPEALTDIVARWITPYGAAAGPSEAPRQPVQAVV